MTAGLYEYTLSLNDKLSGKLQKIGVTSKASAEKFKTLNNQTKLLERQTKDVGTCFGTLQSKTEMLCAGEKKSHPSASLEQSVMS